MADNRALFGDKKIEKELKTTLDDLLALASNNKKENEGNAKYEKSKNIAKPKTQMKNVNPLTVETYDNQHRKTINSTKKQHRIYDTTVQVSRDELKTQKPPEAVRRSKSVVRDIYNTSEISINNTPDDEVDDDSFQESELSIEEMVANAVVSKKSSKSRFVERTATEEDAIPDEELTRILDAEGTLDEYLGNDELDDVVTLKWYKNKKIMIFLSSFVFVILAIAITAVAIFKNYYNMLQKPIDYVKQPGVQDSKTDSDTVDADDYDAWLAQQLAGIAGSTMSNENVTNILLMAEDLRDTSNSNARGNSDVIMLVSINKETKMITLTSFMRDIYCPIDGFYSSRLNSAYAKGGPETLMATLKSNFGIDVDRYVKVNFSSFAAIVDAIGGVETNVTDQEAKEMNFYVNEQNRLFKKASGTDKMTAGGNMTLNGNRALAYCRIRYNVGDDFGRTERQRKVISAAINQVKGLSLSEIDKLAKIVMPETETNLSEGELASLLLNSVSYMNYSQQQLQIPATGTWTNATIRGASVLSVNFVKNAKLLQETIYGKSKIDIIDPNEGIYTNTQKTVTSTTSKITAKKTTTTPPSSSNNNSNVTTPEPVTDKPTDTTVTTTKPITTTPTTTPPVTDPPVTDPPVTDPPVSEIPANPNEALAG